MDIFEIKNLTCGYQRDVDIVKNFSMKVVKNTVVTILGPNGAGKSTILKAIFGALHPREGKILFKDQEITGLTPYRVKGKGISLIPQSSSTFPYMSVGENIKMGAWTLRKNKRQYQERLERIYADFPILAEMKQKQAAFLSGGQQKMLEIAKGVITPTELLLIDEPSAGLAPKIAKQVYQWALEFKKEASIILVDQDIRSAVEISDYIYFIRLGENHVEGPKGEIESRLDDIVYSCLTDAA